MPRARNIKPAFFHDAALLECEHWVRLLFVGLWTVADREGRLVDNPRQIKIDIFPADEVDVASGLDQLRRHGLILRYAVARQRFIQVRNFGKHQSPHYKEELSRIPPPPGWSGSGVVATGPSAKVRADVLARDARCQSCGATDDLTLDHIVPRSRGGTNDPNNLQALCRRCNSAKHNRQAKKRVSQPSAKHEPTSANESGPLASDSGFLIPDTGLRIPDARAPAREPTVSEKEINDENDDDDTPAAESALARWNARHRQDWERAAGRAGLAPAKAKGPKEPP